VSGTLTRLKELALRPLWSESALHRARRRCRTLITTPFAALGGLAWGVYAAPAIGVGSQLLWGALGAFALPFFMYLEQRLVPAFAELAHRWGLGEGHVAALAAEAGVVGGLVFLLTSVLGAPIVPAVGTALGVGAFYAVTMEYILCGSAAADVAGLIRGAGSVSMARGDQLSQAEALTARGQHDEAIALYEAALERSPRDAALYLRLSRVEAAKGDPERGVETLRAALGKADLSPDRDAYLVRQLLELCVVKLGDPRAALPDLRALARRQPEGQHGDWARREISDIEDGLYDRP